MKAKILTALLAALLTASAAHAGTAFLVREYVTGMTRQCVYDYLGSKYIVTVDVIDLCPLTIEV